MKTHFLILTAALLLPTTGTLRAQEFNLGRLTAAGLVAPMNLPIPAEAFIEPAALKTEKEAYLADQEPAEETAQKGGPAAAAAALGGDGTVKFYHQWSKESLEIRYRGADGRYLPEALARIRHLFRCRLTGKEMEVPTGLIELLDRIQEKAGGRTLTIICGYRSPELNGSLASNSGAVAKKSLHMRGLAADIMIEGVGTAALRDLARSLKAGGVGYYPADGFVHVDVGTVRYW